MSERATAFRHRQHLANETVACVRTKARDSEDGMLRLTLAIAVLLKDPSQFVTFDRKMQGAIIAMAGLGIQHVVGGLVEAELMEAGEL